MLKTGENCWRIEQAVRAATIIDADDYFNAARAAFLKARRRIMLIGWDFDARIAFGENKGDDGPETIGDFIYWLVERNPELEVFLLRWDLGAVKTLFRGSTIFTVMKWMTHDRIHTKLDGMHPPGASHHQKIVVIDDCFAFCGGIDMTGDRWDTREHRDDDPRRKRPNGKLYDPWHDATTALEGPVAAALGELARDRWHRAGGHELAPVTSPNDCWPDPLEPQFTHVEVAIARTVPKMDDQEPIDEIEKLYLDQIAAAERFIYAESQYFASRRIAEALAKRLDEKDGPEIILVNPQSAQGWLEPIAMDTARARLFEALRRRDNHGHLRMYHPFTANDVPIYVHAKILIVDDRILRVGSSNMNNRSLGLDTECDVTIDTRRPGNDACSDTIIAVRDGLLAEHLGVTPQRVAATIAQTGSLIAAIETLSGGGGRTLRAYQTPDLAEVEKWLADNEVLDPESPDDMFETLDRPGLLQRLHGWRHHGDE
ncbi:phospholipase D/transphosphatidylase [Sphingomonas sp. DBB INV C78]|uniref:phospholipase D-like domain-containing protein n=1 Tax=Sphingomonas sp. DBB INV C78 TaxID=3349434 RepID=UPI0036D26DB1